MAILVTGGAGDVGSRLVSNIAGEGEKVVVFDVADRPSLKQGAGDRVKMVKGNILNLSELIRAIRENDVQVVAHLAAMLTGDTEARPLEGVSVNTLGTASVAEACRLTGVKRLVYTSTSSVYGPTGTDVNVTEEYPKDPKNIYGAVKLAAELFARNFASKYGIEFTALRLRLIFGAGQRSDTGMMFLLRFGPVLSNLFAGKPAILPYPSRHKLEFTHPLDAAAAILLACKAPRLPHEAYNIKSTSCTCGEIAETLKSAIPKASVSCDENAKDLGRPFGTYDLSLAQKELSYRPAYDVRRIVTEIVEFEKASRNKS